MVDELDTQPIDPLDFLRHLVDGVDVRRVSKVWSIAQSLEADRLDVIEPEEWEYFLEILERELGGGGIVTTTDSMNAAKTLAEYLYPKRKTSDASEVGRDGVNSIQGSTKLTEDEITLFKEIFNDEF